MNNVAIIPARGGSKRIPNKNIKLFLGKPIISYPIKIALESNLFKRVIVSTDSEEIAEIAIKYGAEVPFLRSSKNSDDYATTNDVLKEVLANLDSDFDKFCCIYPTSPLLDVRSLELGLKKLTDENFDTVFPVVSFSYPILRSLKIDDKGKAEMNWPEYKNSRSQDLPKAYHDSGMFYWAKTLDFLASGSLWTSNTGVIELPESKVQDIDTLSDWSIAELKYKLLHNENI